MIGWLRLKLDPEVRTASRQAKAWFADNYPDLPILDIRIVAAEQERYVFAVLYRGSTPSRPAPYKLVGVSRHSKNLYEIDLNSDSTLRLRCYK